MTTYAMTQEAYEVLITGKKNSSLADRKVSPHMFERATPLKTKKAVIEYLNRQHRIKEIHDIVFV